MESNSKSIDMTAKFKEILKSNQITDPVAEVIVKDSGLKGENMCSVTSIVTVKFQNPKLKELHLFMKCMTNASQAVLIEEAKMFEKEVSFLNNYLPQARELCKRMGQEDLMNVYPKCYYADEKMIVFENLVIGKGYVLLNKLEQLDFEQTRFALGTLAKIHAISHAFLKDIGGQEEFFQRFPGLDLEAYKTNTARSMMEPAIENGIATNIKILEESDLEGKEEAISVLKTQQGKTYAMILEPVERDRSDGFQILNHGDYWTNNMLFLIDKETHKVTGHISVDFQLTRYCSPSVDLGYFLFTSVKLPVRLSRLEDLFKEYLEILNQASKDLGHPIEMTYEQLYKDFCKNFKFGYFIGTFMSNGAGYEALKGVDPSEWSANFTQLIEKWIENNPEKAKENAKQLIQIIKEYQRFSV